MSMMSHAATLPRMGADTRSAGVFARFLVIALTAFLTVVDLFATQAILPSLTRAYGVSPAAMGSAVNASTLGMAIAGLCVAIFSRKIDRRLGILISLAVLAIPTALLASAPNLAVFTMLRVVQGLCMASAFTLTLAYLGEHPSAVDSATASAAYITGNVASNFIGRFVSAGVADHFGLASNFYFFAALNLAGAVLVYFAVHRTPPAHCLGRTVETQFASWALHLRDPRLLAAFGIGFCILFAFIGTFTYVNFVLVGPPFMTGPMELGFVYFVFLPSVLTTPLAGRVIGRLGTRATFWASFGLAGAGPAAAADPELFRRARRSRPRRRRHLLRPGDGNRLCQPYRDLRPRLRQRHLSRLLLLRRHGGQRRAGPDLRSLRMAGLRRRHRRVAGDRRAARGPPAGVGRCVCAALRRQGRNLSFVFQGSREALIFTSARGRLGRLGRASRRHATHQAAVPRRPCGQPTASCGAQGGAGAGCRGRGHGGRARRR